MSNNLIVVPKSWDITLNGKTHTVQNTSDYNFKCKEYDICCSITDVVTRQNDDLGESWQAIVPKVELRAGHINPIKECTAKDEFRIYEDTVITPISTTYTSDKKSAKEIADTIKAMGMSYQPKTDTFTFLFNTRNFAKDYRITIDKREFVGLSVKKYDKNGPSDQPKPLYGQVVDVSEDSVIMDRYFYRDGRRSIEKYTIKTSALVGAFRYQLDIRYRRKHAMSFTEVAEKLPYVKPEIIDAPVEGSSHPIED